MDRSRHFAVFVLAATCLVAREGSPQQADFATSVERVRIQVAVRDDAGDFVKGLGAGDFELLVDGNRRPVRDAFEVDLRRAPGAATASDSGATVPVGIPAAARRRFLIFFDFAFNGRVSNGEGLPDLGRRAFNEALRGARDFVAETVRDGDLIAVAFANRFGFEQRLPFTADHARARAVLDEIGMSDATDAQPFDADDFSAYVAFVANYLAQLEEYGRILGAVEGTKHVILFSTGFSDQVLVGGGLDQLSSAAEDRAGGGLSGIAVGGDPEADSGSAEVRDGIKRVAESFRAADARVHAVDARRLGSFRRSGRQSLSYLADGTGGSAHWNNNRVGPALQTIEEATAHYYVLAYDKSADDPEAVRLDIAVPEQEDFRVQAPGEFSPPPPYRQMSELQRNLVVTDALAHDDDVLGVLADADLVALPGAPVGQSRLLSFIEIPAHEIDRLRRMRGEGVVELDFAAFVTAEDGGLEQVFSEQVVHTSGRNAEALPLRWRRNLVVSAEAKRLRWMVRESAVGEVSARTRPLPHVSRSGSGEFSRPVILVEAPAPRARLSIGPGSPARGQLLPVARPRLARGGEVIIWFAATGLAEQDPALLLYTSDAEVALRVQSLERRGEGEVVQFFARVQVPASVPAGEAEIVVVMPDDRLSSGTTVEVTNE
ncbi:MAG: VWA domain-containing protein [Acidobacteria bacterium]|nr:VWA domain-containing protein [Acidobacteriota bacterium]